jgi:hypothetical protein
MFCAAQEIPDSGAHIFTGDLTRTCHNAEMVVSLVNIMY